MAAALSRALKLPGKKGSELGEYDPLTQADSDDDSEEDDLVLNYPRNGLGRDGYPGAGPSRPGRPLGGGDQRQEEEEEEEEEEWRERLGSKPRGAELCGRERLGEERGGPGGPIGATCPQEELKRRRRMKNALRGAFFLLPVAGAALLVLLYAFLTPCRRDELQKLLGWERELGEAGGVTPPALTLWDVDGDAVADVLLGVTERNNNSHAPPGNKVHSAVAVSGLGGAELWRRGVSEAVLWLQCLQQLKICLLTSKSTLLAVNATTGKRFWSARIKNVESQAVLLPDLQGDSVQDLLLATLPADQTLDLSLTLISGRNGSLLGRPVPFNLTGQGRLIGPLLHQTQRGAFYILFGLGNLQAISLQELYRRATGEPPQNQILLSSDQDWEDLKTNNSYIHIYRGSGRLDFLLPLVPPSLDWSSRLDLGGRGLGSGRGSSGRDWVLVLGSGRMFLLRDANLKEGWSFRSEPTHIPPAVGLFNSDSVLDVFSQHSANGVMTAQVLNGLDGHVLWSSLFVCPRLVLETSSVSTSTGQSAFLFWAGQPITAQSNATKATVSPGPGSAEPLIRKLFLLHPQYPRILLELHSTTDTTVASAVSYLEPQKDGVYVSVSSRPSPGSEPGARTIRSLSLRAAIAMATLVRLEGPLEPGGAPNPSASEINKFFRHLSFRPQ